jgi:hypothetical protein
MFCLSCAPLHGQAAEKMKLLFGNYDPKTETSIWRDIESGAPRDMDLAYFSGHVAGDVHVLLDQGFMEGAVAKSFFVTWTAPRIGNGFECHVCAPLISAFVLIPNGETWLVESQGRYLGTLGSFGRSEDVAVISIGPDKSGLSFKRMDEFTGEQVTMLSLAVPHGHDFLLALDLRLSWNNHGICGPPLADSCWGYTSHVEFVPGSESEYYDLHISTKGMTLNESYDATVSANATRVFHYSAEDGKYAQTAGPGGGWPLKIPSRR